MSVPGNCGDELSLYLVTRMCSKQVAVITKNDIWYTGKLDNDEEAFISLDDVDLILVYLGKNVFRATKPKPVLIHHTPEPEVKSPSTKDTDYVPSKVYEPESTLPQQHTQSMGSPTIESNTEPASKVHSSPQATPEKSIAHRHRCRKPTQIVIKQEEFKIHRGARRTKISCTLCGKKFECQKDLNDHTTDDHSYRFLCHKRTSEREFSSKASLNKHALTHMPPRYSCTTCGHGFKFQYQLRDTPIPTQIFGSNAGTPGVGGCIKVIVSIIDIINYIKLHIRSTHVPPLARILQKKI